eukprot:CAMPEP_0178984742 /NCGR_PEP_ID=MMETSP0795-20121207/1782_1 /TAXON_ID=88552 /ORGANISM="Amoebophrya sp., Strain Ameob2" /LENGTH=319 /DNA_ID=CAMNT_0020675655 /DNA_START=181 /DNA_END=1136 /DNA_ORIENTATION=-
MAPKAKAAPKSDAAPAAAAAGGAAAGSMGAGTTRLQIMLDKKMVTPQPLAVPDLRAEKDTKTLEKTYHGDPKLLRSDTRGLGKFKSLEGQLNLDEVCEKYLTETETLTLFSVPSLCVALDDTELHGAVSAKNKKYDELLVAKRNAADQFRGQHQQTLNPVMKTKEILALPPKTHAIGVEATEWDIHDTFATNAIPRHEAIEGQIVKDTQLLVEHALKKEGCLFPLEESSAQTESGGGTGSGILNSNTAIDWTLKEDADLSSLTAVSSLMEKSIVQNVFHGEHLTYRNYPTLEQLAKDDERWKEQATDTVSDAEQRIGDL